MIIARIPSCLRSEAAYTPPALPLPLPKAAEGTRKERMSLVVILDDRPTNRNIFSKLAASLESQVTVQAFGDPLDALDWLTGHAPDLVIADYKMPNLDGAEFTRRLRTKPHVADVPVIVITAYDDR